MVRPSVPICSCCIFFIVSEINLRKLIMSANEGNSKQEFFPSTIVNKDTFIKPNTSENFST